MSITAIIIAAAVIAITGIIVGIGLGLFGEKFKVEVDEREAAIREALPGNNCGGCGYPGCDGCAKAINEGKIECPEMPHSQTIQIMCQMDEIRRQFGIVYPQEVSPE